MEKLQAIPGRLLIYLGDYIFVTSLMNEKNFKRVLKATFQGYQSLIPNLKRTFPHDYAMVLEIVAT